MIHELFLLFNSGQFDQYYILYSIKGTVSPDGLFLVYKIKTVLSALPILAFKLFNFVATDMLKIFFELFLCKRL
jgi:hypothetical protein